MLLKLGLFFGVLITCYGIALAQPDPPVLPPALIFSGSVAVIIDGATYTSSILVKMDLNLQKEYVKLTIPALPPSTYFEEYIDFQSGTITMIQAAGGDASCSNVSGIPFPTFTPTFVADYCQYFGPAVIEGQPCQQWNCPLSLSSSFQVNTALFSRGNRLVAETIVVPPSESGPSIVEFLTVDEFIPVPSLPASIFEVPAICSQGSSRRSVMSGIRPSLVGFLQHPMN